MMKTKVIRSAPLMFWRPTWMVFWLAKNKRNQLLQAPHLLRPRQRHRLNHLRNYSRQLLFGVGVKLSGQSHLVNEAGPKLKRIEPQSGAQPVKARRRYGLQSPAPL